MTVPLSCDKTVIGGYETSCDPLVLYDTLGMQSYEGALDGAPLGLLDGPVLGTDVGLELGTVDTGVLTGELIGDATGAATGELAGADDGT